MDTTARIRHLISKIEIKENDIVDFYQLVMEFENRIVDQAMLKAKGNKYKGAYMLTLNRTTLVEKLRKRGLIKSRGDEFLDSLNRL